MFIDHVTADKSSRIKSEVSGYSRGGKLCIWTSVSLSLCLCALAWLKSASQVSLR